jgi:hypothetical protein
MPGRRHDLGALHPNRQQMVNQPLRRASDIALVLRLRADAGNGK